MRQVIGLWIDEGNDTFFVDMDWIALQLNTAGHPSSIQHTGGNVYTLFVGATIDEHNIGAEERDDILVVGPLFQDEHGHTFGYLGEIVGTIGTEDWDTGNAVCHDARTIAEELKDVMSLHTKHNE